MTDIYTWRNNMEDGSEKSSSSPSVPPSNLFPLPFAPTFPEQLAGHATPLAAIQAQEMNLDHLMGVSEEHCFKLFHAILIHISFQDLFLLDKIAKDHRRFHSLIHNRISVVDIGSKRRQYLTKGRLRLQGEIFL